MAIALSWFFLSGLMVLLGFVVEKLNYKFILEANKFQN